MAIKSVKKALAVLEEVASEREGLTVQQLSDRLDLPYATAYRIVSTLHNAGYLDFQPTHKVYHIGPQILRLYGSANQPANLGRVVYPFLSRLNHETGETVHLAIRHQHDVVYLDTILPPLAHGMYTSVGSRAPLHSTALGKALLAFCADKEIEALLAQYRFQRFTPHTIVCKEELWEEMLRIRENGYALDREESSPGVECVASVVVDQTGYPQAAISVSSATRLSKEPELTHFSKLVCSACRDASRAIGGSLGTHQNLWFHEVMEKRGLE